MAENLLARVGANATAFWAHNGHVMAALGEQAEYRDAGTIGKVLRQRLGPKYVTVVSAWSRGSFWAETVAWKPGDEVRHAGVIEQTLPNLGPGTLGAVLSRTGQQAFWVDLNSLPQTDWARAFGRAHYQWGDAGWRVDPKSWNTDVRDALPLRPGADILIYFPTISPARFWSDPAHR
ncbi:hypothetical protein SPAN111604_14465 [Sphingomonas antarctica]